ncbi:MAG: hypothetical protein J6W43_01675 [Prevotella sp.]|nr:hypothetical protein [Prevotella sp.]
MLYILIISSVRHNSTISRLTCTNDILIPICRHILRSPHPINNITTKFRERQAINVVPKIFIHKTITIEYNGGYSKKGSWWATEYQA